MATYRLGKIGTSVTWRSPGEIVCERCGEGLDEFVNCPDAHSRMTADEVLSRFPATHVARAVRLHELACRAK
jgi:hypothetical protein